MATDLSDRNPPSLAAKCHVKLTLDKEGDCCFEIDGKSVPMAKNIQISLDAETMRPTVAFELLATELKINLEGAVINTGEPNESLPDGLPAGRYLPDVLKEVLALGGLPEDLTVRLDEIREFANFAPPEGQRFWWQEAHTAIGTAMLNDPENEAIDEAGRIFQGKDQPLAEGREHLTAAGTFRSDKYDWSKDGFLPLRITDKMAQPMLRAYADARRKVDAEFSRDLHEALNNAGAPPAT